MIGGRCCETGDEDEDEETEERTDCREKEEGESGNTRESELANLCNSDSKSWCLCANWTMVYNCLSLRVKEYG